MESFLDSPIAVCPISSPEDASVEGSWQSLAGYAPFGPVEGDTEFARQCSATAQGYEVSEDCAIPRQAGLRDDTQFDPFLTCPPQVDEFPSGDPIAVERRLATTVLKQLLAEREHARIPLWIALYHPDLVRKVFGHFHRANGMAVATSPSKD